jgi:hypothetical protein
MMKASLILALALCSFSEALLGNDLKDKLRAANLPTKDGDDLLPAVFATDYLPDNFEVCDLLRLSC